MVQFLSLISPAKFDSWPPGSAINEDDHQLRLQLRLDLQNATLVADSTSTPTLDEPKLVERLTNDKWFHILVVSTGDAHETAGTENSERLLTLFTSPAENQIFVENSPSSSTYVWRYGLVQLLPQILLSPTGGWSASLQHDAIKLSPHSDPSHASSSVTVDLGNGTVVVDWTGSPPVRLRLTSLKCYQLPGIAVSVRTVHSSVKG